MIQWIDDRYEKGSLENRLAKKIWFLDANRLKYWFEKYFKKEIKTSLREAYHGSPYATHYFVQEAFEDDKYDGVAIPSDTLLERVPLAVDIHIQRHKEIYKEDVKREDKSARAFGEFAKLVQDLEKQGKNPKIRASY